MIRRNPRTLLFAGLIIGLTIGVIAGSSLSLNARAQTQPPTQPASKADGIAAEGTGSDSPQAAEAARTAFIMKHTLPPAAHAKKLFDLILGVANYDGAKPVLLAGDQDIAENACATYMGGSQQVPTPHGLKTLNMPVVIYNPTFMTQMSFASKDEYVCVYVLAHELGHIACGHVDPNNPATEAEMPWQKELEADRYAGKCLAKLGAEPEELELAHRIMVATKWIKPVVKDGKLQVYMADKQMRLADLVTGSSTHPDAVRRIQAIAMGWKEGGGKGDVEENLGRIFTQMVTQVTRWEPGQ